MIVVGVDEDGEYDDHEDNINDNVYNDDMIWW